MLHATTTLTLAGELARVAASTVILVDDMLASGRTAAATITVLRSSGFAAPTARLIVAVPLAVWAVSK